MLSRIKGYDVDVLGLGSNCPNCGDSQFSVSHFDHFRPEDLPSYILGTSECRGCQKTFFVRLALELKMSIIASIVNADIRTAEEVIGVLFGD